MIRTGISQQDINDLVAHDSWPAVTITLNTSGSGPNRQHGPIRLKNFLLVAEERLVAAMMRRTVAHDLLAGAGKLIGDTDFWGQKHAGLAIFIAEGSTRVFRLAFHVDDSLDVAACFNVLPLLPAFTACQPYNVLVLDKHHVRLVKCTGWSSSVVKLDDMPTDIDTFVRTEYAAEARQHAGGNGRMVAGPGGADSSAIESARLRRFLVAIDHAVNEHSKHARDPLVLAGTRDVQALFRSISKNPNLVEQGLHLTSKGESNEELRLAARPLVEALSDAPRHTEVERYRAKAGTGLTSQQIEEILVAAYAGKVESLLIGRSQPVWGKFDDLTGAVCINDVAAPTDENLVNRAALGTLRHKGTVFPVRPDELELAGAAAAVFRF